MFNKKRAVLPICCDMFIDLYDKCNYGCEMCKFNRNVENIEQMKIDFDKYKDVKVLFCYKTEPYNKDDYSLVENAINKLHNNNCRIVFLTRKSNSLEKQLNLFNKNDFVGVSLSENSSKNSDLNDIKRMLVKAKKLNIRTWISLEPVINSDFANNIITELEEYVDLFRVGKDDLFDYDWEATKKDIVKSNKVYLKD